MDKAHEAQLLNYLRATEIEVGLLLNFGLKPEFKRKIFMNDKKIARRSEENADRVDLSDRRGF